MHANERTSIPQAIGYAVSCAIYKRGSRIEAANIVLAHIAQTIVMLLAKLLQEALIENNGLRTHKLQLFEL